MSTPTQIRRPWTATLRTIVQVAIPTILALGIVVPQIVQIVLDESGEAMPEHLRVYLLGISAAVVAVSAALARIMAIPQVELLLRRYKITRPLAAQPKGSSIDVT